MKNYLIEAWALGMFMVSAVFFTAVFELPGHPFHIAVDSPLLRRFFIGLAMGLTAIGLIYSGWGRQSGAHMNPSMTLTFWALNKIKGSDAVAYILAQFIGGTLAIGGLKLLFPHIIGAPQVSYVQTLPGAPGILPAFAGEFVLSFFLVLMVLYSSNDERTKPYTGLFAGCMVMLYITIEAPFSGMSINPARTFASAFGAGNFRFLWLYFLAPTMGMLAAAYTWEKWICQRADFNCSLHHGG